MCRRYQIEIAIAIKSLNTVLVARVGDYRYIIIVKKQADELEGRDFENPDVKHEAEHGVRLEPFNMRREMREGGFEDTTAKYRDEDDEGGFVFDRVENLKQVTDPWLDQYDLGKCQMSEKDITRLRENQEKIRESAKGIFSLLHKTSPLLH